MCPANQSELAYSFHKCTYLCQVALERRGRLLNCDPDRGLLEHLSSAHFDPNIVPSDALEGLDTGCVHFLKRLPLLQARG
jgi:hypothetical protein